MHCTILCCFKQETAYEMRISDWSSDVCSSDLQLALNPDNPILLHALKQFEPGNKQAPVPLLSNAVDGLAEAMFASASAFGRGDGGELAELHLQLALFLRPDLDDARMLLGDIYESRDRWQEALRAYSAVSTNSAYTDRKSTRLTSRH